MRAALYARYSTDLQRPTSIEDQVRLARARADSANLEVVAVHSDEGVSGSMPIEQRAGGRALMTDAASARFDVLILEALDRFSRNLVDQERVVRRLEFNGVRIIGVLDGYDSATEGREMMRAVRGSFNEQLLRDIAKKTHRGLRGQIARGYHAGGLSYGYRSVIAGVDAKGEPIGHRLEIEPIEADVVRWIFARYTEGWSCQRLAADLNGRAVPSPRGGTWAVSAIYGSPNKGSGILNNKLYVGSYVWNRSKWTKDPDSGRRRRMDRPREEWIAEERPELRILEDEAWRKVRARLARKRLEGGPRGAGARPQTLFGGMLKCGKCGGAVIAANARMYGCAARKDRGAVVCVGMYVPREATDARLLSVVRDELLAPSAIAELQDLISQVLAEHNREDAPATTSARKRLAELEKEIQRLVDGVAAAGWSQSLVERLRAAESERARLRTLATRKAHGLASINTLQRHCKEILMRLGAELHAGVPRARAALQELLGEVTLTEEAGRVYAGLETRPERLLMAAGGDLEMVAGTDFGFGSRRRIRIT